MELTKAEVKALIDKLLGEIEEEDVGISLFSTFYQDEQELAFFAPADRERVLKILKKLLEDSKRHKGMLEQIIAELGKSDEN